MEAALRLSEAGTQHQLQRLLQQTEHSLLPIQQTTLLQLLVRLLVIVFSQPLTLLCLQ